MSRVNKFANAYYQVLRKDIKKEKDPKKKVWMMRVFLDDEENRTYENYVRLKNLTKTTAMAYKDPEVKKVFNDFLEEMDSMDFTKRETEPIGPENIATKDLEELLRDLKSRKYDFQFSKTPQDHIDFVEKIEAELASRKNK